VSASPEAIRAALDESRRQVQQLLDERHAAAAMHLRATRALLLATLLEHLEDSGMDVTVGWMAGIGAAVEVHDPDTGGRWEYEAPKLHMAVEAARSEWMKEKING